MATTATIDRLTDHVGTSITLCGWVYNTRTSGKIVFILLRDGTGLPVFHRIGAGTIVVATAGQLQAGFRQQAYHFLVHATGW